MDEFYTEVGRRALGVLKDALPGKFPETMLEMVIHDGESVEFFRAALDISRYESQSERTPIEYCVASNMFAWGLIAGAMTARAICEERQLAGMMGVPHE